MKTRTDDRATLLTVRVQPGASRDAVTAVALDPPSLEVKVRARPKDGEANDAVVRLLSAELHVPKSSIAIHRGESGRTKILRIGLPESALHDRLKTLSAHAQHQTTRT
ncbi:MAG: DUF167 domain-containing protein [Hyphomicrobiales bacterium]